jgi:signal transduction histidine kinase
MNQLEQLRRSLTGYLVAALLFTGGAMLGTYVILSKTSSLSQTGALIASGVGGLLLSLLLGKLITSLFIGPLANVWQSVLHLSPTEQGNPAPDPNNLKVGRELVANLTGQIFQLANVAEHAAAVQQKQRHDLHQEFIAQNLPLPLIILDPAQNIQFANEAAAIYIGIAAEDMTGKNVYMVMDMSFPSEDTFDRWLKDAHTKSATAVKSWERVRLNVRDGHPPRHFDLAAYYNRENPDKHETIMVMFDHTEQYSQDDQAVSFIALSVHELRTPLTLLRGYIEVFEEELGNNVSPELNSFMLKMRAMSEQLNAFVNNILNVARVDADQLELRLQPENWSTVLKLAVEMISLRAKVRGIKLSCRIQTDLPEVGADRLSITEVINNLVDNAIKYSGNSREIKINTYLNKEGLIETTVQDFGVGVPASVLPNLFTKFYRDHRNRAQIGGTGLGLYLSKAIVNAHGGSLWVQSQEGKGSTFGFTLQPYSKIEENQPGGDQDITRSAHGWIKNHSLYRR